MIGSLKYIELKNETIDQLKDIEQNLEAYCKELNDYLYAEDWRGIELRQYINPSGFDENYKRLQGIFSVIDE